MSHNACTTRALTKLHYVYDCDSVFLKSSLVLHSINQDLAIFIVVSVIEPHAEEYLALQM